MIVVTVEMLREIARGGKQSNYKLFQPIVTEINNQFEAAGIDTIPEVCHFLAQAAEETNSFNTLEEYASGKAYEGRTDLGNTSIGDGIKYKGRGIFQTTGKVNYRRLSMLGEANFVVDPGLLEQPKYAVWSAIIFWNDRHLSDIANMPDTATIYSKRLNRQLHPVEYITYRINGGLNGLDDRKMFYERAKNVIK